MRLIVCVFVCVCCVYVCMRVCTCIYVLCAHMCDLCLYKMKAYISALSRYEKNHTNKKNNKSKIEELKY